MRVHRRAAGHSWRFFQERLRGFGQRLAEPGDSSRDGAPAATSFSLPEAPSLPRFRTEESLAAPTRGA